MNYNEIKIRYLNVMRIVDSIIQIWDLSNELWVIYLAITAYLIHVLSL
jgi:hypothetical protein